MYKKIAFTLAEVLITLSIIGIIAELTIPDLVHDFRQQNYNAGVKASYSLLSEVVERINTDQDFLATTKADIITQLCTYYACIQTGTAFDIWGQGDSSVRYRYYYGGNKTDWPNSSGTDIDSAVLKNGYFIDTFWALPTCSYYGVNACAMIQVDINGNNGPNMFREDAYRFFITKIESGKYAVIPMGTPNETYSPTPTGCTYGSTGMATCSGCTYQRLYFPDTMK